jgi:tRNA threonylcarbamoyladenosine biosynthesis protein TsaB
MMLLALDTATKTMGIALHDGSQVLAESIWSGGGHHTIELAPEIALMLRRIGGSTATLSSIAVAQGPGSYTGLRIGMALAKGLALTHNLPLVGIPTLDILVKGQSKRPEPLLAVIQAGRHRIAGVWYTWGPKGWQSQGEAESLTWIEVRERLEERTYICGELDPTGREVLAEQPNAILAQPAQCVRRPSFLAELAWERLRAGMTTDPTTLMLIYLKSQTEHGQ